MRCPYCVSAIDPKALVCPVCRRDLFLFKPLLERIESLEAEVLAASQGVPDSQLPDGEGAELAASSAAAEPSWRQALLFFLLPLVVLLAGHLLFNFVYDTRPLYLRLLALIAPLPFGLLFARASRLNFWPGAGLAFLLATSTVLAMSGVTALIDKVPLWPASLLELREFIEFSTSIALSFITGIWIALWQQRRRQLRRPPPVRPLAGLATVGGPQVKESLLRLNDVGSAVVACATTLFSIYTGLKGFIG
jgi:hypothetical protein